MKTVVALLATITALLGRYVRVPTLFSHWSSIVLLFSSAASLTGAPAITSITPVLDGFQINFAGESNATYLIQASTNVQTWFPVATNTEAMAERRVLAPAFGPHCFYRAASVGLRFSAALSVQEIIDLNGNNILVDSFDSEDPRFSTGGAYDPAKRKDGGDLVSNFSNWGIAIQVGNATVYGRVLTRTNMAVGIGVNGNVGSIAWHSAGNTGIEPGSLQEHSGLDYGHVVAPTGPFFTPTSGIYAGTYREYLLGHGRYAVSNLSMTSGSMFVHGDAILYVTGEFTLAGTAALVIAPGARLQLYVADGTASLGGGGVQNSNGPTAFVYYGLPTNLGLVVSLNGTLVGCIYAPHTDLTLNGGGTQPNHFVGAIVSRSVTVNGHVQVHYDESLARH